MNNNTALQLRADSQLETQHVEALRQIMEQATPKNEIRVRQGRGGMQLKYTDGAYVIRTLNQAFGWDWDFVADNEELLTHEGKPFEVKVRGTLTVRYNGLVVTKTQFGCQPIDSLKSGAPVSIGDAYKGAATDAMKKCASLLGIALDLYDSDSEVNTGRPKPQPAPPAPPRQAQPARQPEPEVYEAEPVPEPEPTWAPFLELEGPAGYVVKLARNLQWTEADVIAQIQKSFDVAVMPGKLKDYLEFATKDELRELYRIMNSKGGKR